MIRAGYYIDRVRINSKREFKKLKQVFNLQRLTVKIAYETAMKFGFRSRLDLVAPTEKDLAVILKNESRIHPYKIAYLEVAKDSFQKNLHDAEMVIFHNLKTLDRRWSTEGFDYFQTDENYEHYKKRKTGLGTLTRYLGPKNFRYVQYARLSKINRKPCFHEEFRISGAKKIRQKTGISTIADLIIFDPQEFLDRELEKMLTKKTIDMQKLGRWLAGIDGRRKKLTRQEKIKCQIHVRHFCSTYEIETFNDLKKTLSGLNKEIRKHPGAKNEFQKRVLALKGNYSRFQLKSN
jgi:hypothetical protein